MCAGGLLCAPFLRGVRPLFSGAKRRKKDTFGAKGAFLENFYDFFEKFVNKNAIKVTFSKKLGPKIFLKK